MPGQEEITAYHRSVTAEVKRALGVPTTIRSLDRRDWHHARPGTTLECELLPVDKKYCEIALRGREGRYHRVFVYPLNEEPTSFVGTFWVSWHESWCKQNPEEFALLNAGWTLFEGLSGNQDKNQVLRADWDQLPHKGSKHAGHPHWHFDHWLFISAEPAKVEVRPGLVEVATDTAFSTAKQASVGFIHLAMGAWNGDVGHPQCWQRTYQDDCQQLCDWCVKTLTYLKDQVGGC